MIVSHSHKVIFVGNPKAGSSSITAALSALNEEPGLAAEVCYGLYTRHHMPAYVLREVLGLAKWNDYFKFAFVRNPWDWFVSQHFYNLQKLGEPHDIDAPLSLEDVYRTYRYLRIYRGAAWVESACQNAFICDNTGNVLVDFLGRFEKFEDDFAAITALIGLGTRLPRINASAHRYYRDYYTSATAEVVRELYQVDIDIFSYDF